MTTAIPSFEEYEHAKQLVADNRADPSDVASAQQWIREFEDAIWTDVKSALPWESLTPRVRSVAFQAAMVGARTAQGGAR